MEVEPYKRSFVNLSLLERLKGQIMSEDFLFNYLDAEDLNGSCRLLRNIRIARELGRFREGPDIEEVNGESLTRFLERFRKPSFLERDLSDYSVKAGFERGWHSSLLSKGSYYGDTDYQFLLCHEDKLIASLGFETHPGAILVSQIQGLSGMKSHLEPIKWPNALLNISIAWASNIGIPEVWVLPHERNRWIKAKTNAHGAKFYYDITAKREGFKYDEERRVYRKRLL